MNETKELPKLDYDGDLTLEALSVLEIYTKQCCNKSATARKLSKTYNRVYQYLKQPYVREFFKLKLLESGVTPQKIAGVIFDGLDASNGVYSEGQKVATEPNWMARQRFAQLAAEILEVLKYQTKVDVTNNTVNITSIKQVIEEASRQQQELNDNRT